MQLGTRPPHPGDVVVKMFEASGWAEAMAVLHQFMDTKGTT